MLTIPDHETLQLNLPTQQDYKSTCHTIRQRIGTITEPSLWCTSDFLKRVLVGKYALQRGFLFQIGLLFSHSFIICIFLRPITPSLVTRQFWTLIWCDFYEPLCYIFLLLFVTVTSSGKIEKTLPFSNCTISLISAGFNVIILWFWLKWGIIFEIKNCCSWHKIWLVF